MNNNQQKKRIEFGDFQTPDSLALDICKRLFDFGIQPDIVIEPTCGKGAFVAAADKIFPSVQKIMGFEINNSYLDMLRKRLPASLNSSRIELEEADFFNFEWGKKISTLNGSVLVLGNFPWVTNSAQGVIGGNNLPKKSNFLNQRGFDAISGKSNFDISEWMLLEVFHWFKNRVGDIAMLVKTSVARKVLAQAKKQNLAIWNSFLVAIDAKQHFGASVDACLLVIRFTNESEKINYDYTIFKNIDCFQGQRVGHRMGLTIGNIDSFTKHSSLVGKSPQKWRSGIKHDAAAIMEFTRTERGLENGLKEVVLMEDKYLFPLLKGSDVGSEKEWRKKYVLVTQKFVGESTDLIRESAPLTWNYLLQYRDYLYSRGSIIYEKQPQFSIFGVGDYAFRPWRIAICALYKKLHFRLVEPIDGKPVMFDDTVYYLSFDTKVEAAHVLCKLNSQQAIDFLSSLIFWDEKRPIKTSILNMLDWSRLNTINLAVAKNVIQSIEFPHSLFPLDIQGIKPHISKTELLNCIHESRKA